MQVRTQIDAFGEQQHHHMVNMDLFNGSGSANKYSTVSFRWLAQTDFYTPQSKQQQKRPTKGANLFPKKAICLQFGFLFGFVFCARLLGPLCCSILFNACVSLSPSCSSATLSRFAYPCLSFPELPFLMTSRLFPLPLVLPWIFFSAYLGLWSSAVACFARRPAHVSEGASARPRN